MPSEQESYDLKLAQECATAFSRACGVGCVVSDVSGIVCFESGYGCSSCEVCKAAGRRPEECIKSQIYSTAEAARFGGKYVYFCPMGLSCFVSPILGSQEIQAKLTVGPFLMVDRDDYRACDLEDKLNLSGKVLERTLLAVEHVPCIPPDKVTSMSTLLFMAVSFMNNLSATERMLAAQGSNAIQGQITAYIQQIKRDSRGEPYPFEKEDALLWAVRQNDRKQAQQLLNELLGHMLLTSGGALYHVKNRIYELLVLISRTAIRSGANAEDRLRDNDRYLEKLNQIQTFDDLCLWLSGVMNHVMDSVFDFTGLRHAGVINQSIQYINTHYDQRLTLETVASRVFLSPPYFSRIFKEETGETFTAYLNRVRVDRSRELLRHKHLRLADIALLVGFEDQSYFTKVFKKITGIPPLRYREGLGNIK